jgi:hypothetical protein
VVVSVTNSEEAKPAGKTDAEVVAVVVGVVVDVEEVVLEVVVGDVVVGIVVVVGTVNIVVEVDETAVVKVGVVTVSWVTVSTTAAGSVVEGGTVAAETGWKPGGSAKMSVRLGRGLMSERNLVSGVVTAVVELELVLTRFVDENASFHRTSFEVVATEVVDEGTTGVIVEED